MDVCHVETNDVVCRQINVALLSSSIFYKKKKVAVNYYE